MTNQTTPAESVTEDMEKRFIAWALARDDDWWQEGHGSVSIWDFRIMQGFFEEEISQALAKQKEEIVEEYGEYRLIKKFGLGLIKYGRTLRFYLSPHTKHKEGDDDFTF